jgi:predicted regulator of Ras-like GTPase activity (Roadblock/LC7/MglB family)
MASEKLDSRVPERLVEQSADVRSAVLIDAAGNLIGASEPASERARRLAELAAQLVATADSAVNGPVEQIEAHTEGGSVYAMRDARQILACVARRQALPSLVLYDLRRALAGDPVPA